MHTLTHACTHAIKCHLFALHCIFLRLLLIYSLLFILLLNPDEIVCSRAAVRCDKGSEEMSTPKTFIMKACPEDG